MELGHTFTGNGEQDDAARSLHVRYCQVPYDIYLSVQTPNEETYSILSVIAKAS
jgi:hypothetical protein